MIPQIHNPDPELLKEIEQLKQSVTELQSLLEAANQERLLLEHELIQVTEKARRSQLLNYDFLAGIFHEIKTPVNGIFGFLGHLKDNDISREEQQKFIEIMQNACQSLIQTFNAILEHRESLRNQDYTL